MRGRVTTGYITNNNVVNEFLEIDGGQLVSRNSRAESGIQFILEVDGPFFDV